MKGLPDVNMVRSLRVFKLTVPFSASMAALKSLGERMNTFPVPLVCPFTCQSFASPQNLLHSALDDITYGIFVYIHLQHFAKRLEQLAQMIRSDLSTQTRANSAKTCPAWLYAGVDCIVKHWSGDAWSTSLQQAELPCPGSRISEYQSERSQSAEAVSKSGRLAMRRVGHDPKGDRIQTRHALYAAQPANVTDRTSYWSK